MTSDVFKVLGQRVMEQYVARRIAAGVHLEVVRSRRQEAGQRRWLSRAEELRMNTLFSVLWQASKPAEAGDPGP